MRRLGVLIVALLSYAGTASAQANGQLQIHYLNVGQGDATLIISPRGQTMLIDTGPLSASDCTSSTGIISQLTAIGLTQLTYHVASHYDPDHIGCSDHVLAQWPVQVAYDRGTVNTPSTQTYTRYATAAAGKRQTVMVGQEIVLDSSSASPVVIEVVAVNGNGTAGSLTESDRSIVLVLHFGLFDAVFGGDLSGDTSSAVHNIEGLVAASVGRVEVYKVHHHGSATSSSSAWMSVIRPRAAILSVGSPNASDHPTQAALDRIRAVDAITFWTTAGDGASGQPGFNYVANGTVRIDVRAESYFFMVNFADQGRRFLNHESTRHDFDLDRSSDLLWRHTSGDLTLWLMDGSQAIGGGSAGSADLAWQIAGVGDFDRDGRSDILWRHTSGAVTIWLMNGTQIIGGGYVTTVDPSWQIVGTGDFDVDRRADIVWRHTSGALVIWLMNGATVAGGGSVGTVDVDWQIVGTGNYNGIGGDDLLWRHTSGAIAIWFMNGTTLTGGGAFAEIDPLWQIQGTGDHNGDRRADILWRHSTTGQMAIWLLDGATTIGGGGVGFVNSAWQIAASGDYNGDSRADVMWRHSSGALAVWFMNGHVTVGGGAMGPIDLAWQIVPTR
jgi:beta-lactamase superfamily II metal-dependent hydrolase